MSERLDSIKYREIKELHFNWMFAFGILKIGWVKLKIKFVGGKSIFFIKSGSVVIVEVDVFWCGWV